MTKIEARIVIALIVGALRLDGELETADQIEAAAKVLQEPEPQKYPATVGGLVRLVRDLGVVSVRADAHSVTVDHVGAAWTFPVADDPKPAPAPAPAPSDLEARRQRVWDVAFVAAEAQWKGTGPNNADAVLRQWDREQARAMSGPLPKPAPANAPGITAEGVDRIRSVEVKIAP